MSVSSKPNLCVVNFVGSTLLFSRIFMNLLIQMGLHMNVLYVVKIRAPQSGKCLNALTVGLIHDRNRLSSLSISIRGLEL